MPLRIADTWAGVMATVPEAVVTPPSPLTMRLAKSMPTGPALPLAALSRCSIVAGPERSLTERFTVSMSSALFSVAIAVPVGSGRSEVTSSTVTSRTS